MDVALHLWRREDCERMIRFGVLRVAVERKLTSTFSAG